ncbi:thymidylate synthase [Baekduia soli]|uniref:Thymidylate synthase n=1 Tax=Baekduia soli TaxID=496014 RepID=A0A5B8U2P8_9ACTN|nr:FAD-dependent thymidylate synthase [Baekduia soli]QEC47202.1 thymidylate synthase [Baekduia soli]
MDYPVETFSPAERAVLAPHVTNLDRPVFALVNLPETVKGALFARYSRYQGTLRRLFLDEFAESLPGLPAFESGEGRRAADLYDRIFLGYGDDSVAQLGGMHVACEWTSNVLTKVLQRPRLASYLEQSTRYIPYDAPMPAGREGEPRYRYYRDGALGPGYAAAMDEVFGVYAGALPRVRAWLDDEFPGDPSPARTRALGAKALDLLRGVLPAAALSHMGIYASGQSYEQLILHLLAHPLPEARAYGQGILEAVQAVMPSFVARVERPDRGGEWVAYLQERDAAAARWAARLGLERGTGDGEGGSSVRLLHVDGDEDALLAALLFEATGVGEEAARIRLAALAADERAAMLADLVGTRANRRHRPGRGFEALRYRFEIVSDYGAFRDLQRHRMLTVQWQQLTPHLGAGVPEEVDAAGCGDDVRRAYETSRAAWQALADAGQHRAAPYALCLGYRIRYVLDLNAREAMQLIELRSGREGHPSYRAVAHEMHRAISAVHPAVGAAMTHVDTETEPRLERILSEMRTQARLDAATS